MTAPDVPWQPWDQPAPADVSPWTTPEHYRHNPDHRQDWPDSKEWLEGDGDDQH